MTQKDATDWVLEDEEDREFLGCLDASGTMLKDLGLTLTSVQQEMMSWEQETQPVKFRQSHSELPSKIPDRQNTIDALLVQSRGTPQISGCESCTGAAKPAGFSKTAEDFRKGPFEDCRVWEGNLDNACGNCIWVGNKPSCNYNRHKVAEAVREEERLKGATSTRSGRTVRKPKYAPTEKEQRAAGFRKRGQE